MKVDPGYTRVEDAALPTQRATRHRRRRVPLLAAAAIVVAVVAGGLWFASRWIGRGPEEVSLSGAVDRFRSSSSAPQAAGSLVPRAGVYTFSGSGEERLSFLSTSQPEGPTLPGTVTHGEAGCWTFEIEYNSFHRQRWDWCQQDGMLVERGGATHQQFDFGAFDVDETSEITCEPPFVALDLDARPGDTAALRCRGRSETTDTDLTSDGTSRFVGRESLEIAGTSIPVLHYEVYRRITGDQTGEESTEMWFSVDDGMPVRNEREIRVVSPAPAPLKSVTYTEHGAWQLTSLAPRV